MSATPTGTATRTTSPSITETVTATYSVTDTPAATPTETPTCCAPPVPPGIHLDSSNSFTPPATARFTVNVPTSGRLRVEVFDTSGKLVKSLANGPANAGIVNLTWDGTLANGRRAASSVYYIVMRSPGLEQTIPVILLR